MASPAGGHFFCFRTERGGFEDAPLRGRGSPNRPTAARRAGSAARRGRACNFQSLPLCGSGARSAPALACSQYTYPVELFMSNHAGGTSNGNLACLATALPQRKQSGNK